ncbi:putative metalloprotease CJM1_0395 family protein [Marichromatium bheemlicum]|uniref:SprA family protein n=1 Tax=Marichromatium bheemlicum TaxID=365339 RepID=A0ABX1I8Y4_9GAMM|nr:putative metalloprotease CJM1_0395 family protein [Marichromatium bheemlicum]NKN33494.1 hypothetical protein [Marichromatium bheemlicum]
MEIHAGLGMSLRPYQSPGTESAGADAAHQEGTASSAGRETQTEAHAQSSEQPHTPDELRLIEQLRQRDREVRAHEQAHVAAGGRYVTSGPSYDYQTGPDGRQYAIGGEVQIDTSEERDPAATLEKAEALQRAALAPAEPSGQDLRVAAQARAMQIEAQRELRALEQADQQLRQLDGEQTASRARQQGQEVDTGAAAPTAQARLERRIAGLFAPAVSGERLNQFA